MELTAAIRALEALQRSAAGSTLYTDSQYVSQGITEWIANWKARGWRTADRKPVKNQDLWQRLDELASIHDIEWHWVRGHDGHPENERADAAWPTGASTISAEPALVSLRNRAPDRPRH